MTTEFPRFAAATHLFLVRHGETDFNRQRIVQGRGVDVPLNETGRLQAGALARRAATLELDAIFASTLTRAGETADIVAEAVGAAQVHRLSDLEEMSWGVYEGRPRSPELKLAFREMRDRWGAGEYDYAVEQGESVYDVQRRGLAAIHHIVQAHPGQRVLVVTHGRFLRIILASLLPEYGLAQMEKLDHRNTALNHLVLVDGRFEAQVLDCVVHLEEAGIPQGE
ncbi:MAG: histidine phosphatase family protein [Rhodothermales bacterium]